MDLIGTSNKKDSKDQNSNDANQNKTSKENFMQSNQQKFAQINTLISAISSHGYNSHVSTKLIDAIFSRTTMMR